MKYILEVEGEYLDLGSNLLDVRLNNQRFNPVFNKSVESEYSFSFEIPSTPKNNRIFNYADNLSKPSKFNRKYLSKLYVDETLIFEGHLIINSYSYSKKTYNVNLVVVKVYDGQNMFGKHVLSDLVWEVDYQGADTINQINGSNEKYFFPLVSYGKWQKVPYYTDDVASDYTSNKLIDEYCRFWHNSFPPSLNMLEVMKRLFEQFGGVNVGGSAFSDPQLNNIFMSYSIADDQNPQYNLGNEKFGRVHITNATVNTTTDNNKWTQKLDFPYRKVKEAINSGMSYTGRTEYNYSSAIIHNLLGNGTITEPCYMYDPEERLIIAPSDGFYEITLTVSGSMNDQSTTFRANQWYTSYEQDEEMVDNHQVTFTKNFNAETPLEIQLVKNYDDNVELIKGKKNVCYMTGDPTQQSYTYQGGSYQGGTYPNKNEWETDFPHQALYASELPTEENGITRAAIISVAENKQTGGFGGSRGAFSGGARTLETYYSGMMGYMHKDNKVMPYDSAVNPNFICGFSTMDGGNTVSVLKDGYSYDRGNVDENHMFANVDGMEQVVKDLTTGVITKTPTTVNQNTYNNAPSNYFSASSASFSGKVTCCVWLNGGDKLELLSVIRDFNGQQKYGCTINYELDIRAISPRTWKLTKVDPNFAYGMQTEFPYLLNLGNFLNKDTQISDWIENVKNTFNLTITMDGNNLSIDSNKTTSLTQSTNAIDLDKKTNLYNSEVSSQSIDYPSKMGVEWSINTDEYGYETTVPDEHINDSDWEDWGNKGSTIVSLNNPMNEEEEIEQVQFSYCWYTPFTKGDVVYDLATIALSENMIDDFHDTGDTMSKDGFSLTQRFWYRVQQTNDTLPLASNGDEEVYITPTQNNYGNFNLSFKTNEESIFTNYFNGSLITNTSNYVKLKAYLTAEEYKALKGGAMVKFDKDLYLCQNISGYDPSGQNETEITLYK